MPDDKPRDWWGKFQILTDPIGKLLTAVLVVYLGYWGNNVLQQDQKRRASVLEQDQKRRGYIELLSRREEADETLRKDMFGKVIDQFVKPNKGDLENRILNLELLAYNFHESIDLGPLLKQVYAQSWTDGGARSKQRKRLQYLAQEIVTRELVALTEAGCTNQNTGQVGEVHFDKLEKDSSYPKLFRIDCPEKEGLPAKRFWGDVMINPVRDLQRQTEVDVVLQAQTLNDGHPSDDTVEKFEFTVSPFDFPLIKNSRVGGGGRVSVVMTRVDDGGVNLTLVYFPDSRTSLRDKPFNDEVIKMLDETTARH